MKAQKVLLANSTVVRTYLPLKHVFYRPDMVGRLTKWAIELSEFKISFEARKVL